MPEKNEIRILDCEGPCRDGAPVHTTERPQPAVPRAHRFVEERLTREKPTRVYEEIWTCVECKTPRRYGLRG